MKLKCVIDDFKPFKDGGKIVLKFQEDQMDIFLDHVKTFRNNSLIVDFEIDPGINKIDLITPEQRAKIYKIITLFGNEYGEKDDEMKETLKAWYAKGEFSLSNCSKTFAGDFMDFILKKAHEAGYDFGESIQIDSTLVNAAYRAIKEKTCVVCQDKGKIFANSHSKKICVCHAHGEELLKDPDGFLEKHHIELI